MIWPLITAFMMPLSCGLVLAAVALYEEFRND